jgi:cobalt-zinc-cadmium efflux system protein
LTDASVSLVGVMAGIFISYTHLFWIDPTLSVVIVIVIVFCSWGLLKDSFKMLIDLVTPGIEFDENKKVMKSAPCVQAVHNMHVSAVCTTENALTVKIAADENHSSEKNLLKIRKIKPEPEHHNIQHSTIASTKNARSKTVKECDSTYMTTSLLFEHHKPLKSEQLN